MTDSQYSQSQNPPHDPKVQQSGGSTPPGPSQTGTKGGGTTSPDQTSSTGDCDDPNPSKPPKKDPCDETEPIPDPIPCPPADDPCPDKPCPPWPPKPCPPPDPCADSDDKGTEKPGGSSQTQTGYGGGTTPSPAQQSGGKTTTSSDTTTRTTPTTTTTAGQGGATSGQGPVQQNAGGAEGGNGGPKTPADQLKALKKQLEDDQAKLQDLEPLKAAITDIQQRIQSLEKVVDTQSTASAAYKDFYRATEVMVHEIECFIPTVRCQLALNDKQKKCVCDAIAKVDAIVQKAKTASWNQKQKVKKLERQHDRAADDLDWVKKHYDFLKTDLQAQIGKRRDDLKALKGLADPSKDPCEVWFYLYELQRLITEDGGIPDPAWQLDQTAGTYVKYWSPDCYATRLNEAIVMFNDADANEKNLANQLAQAKKTAVDLDKLATDAMAKRRDWILKEIKASDCCGPASKCP